MAIAPFTLHCANPRCQTANSSHDAVCQRCGTPILRRYLWAVGPGSALPTEVGTLIQDRYYLLGDRRVLDTCPGLLPEIPPPEGSLPPVLWPYLHLFPYRCSVPQVYGLMGGLDQPFFLLEGGPIYPSQGLALQADGSYRQAEGELMPSLVEAWPQATPQRQLGWLWQLARLWDPLAREGVAPTLLNPELIRVEGAMVRLLSLEPSPQPNRPPDLAQLGQTWQPWAATAHPSIAPFFQGIVARLLGGGIHQLDQLLPLLDQALALACTGQNLEIQVATCTDSGPQRQQNEDACLPQGGTFRMTRPGPQSITLVCDGLGGHDGGEVASQLSADRIHRYLQTPSNLEDTTPGIAMQRAVHQANEQLLQRNNNEQRFLRQRMGTTVVMSWVVEHLTYLGHVGDSRIYRVTPAGYSQLTVDDDVASLSVTQGQTVYRHAVRPSASGALTQALGITEPEHLRPTVQRFFFDDEMLLLLCSDGVSDRDRVAEVWSRILQPVFTEKVNVAVSAKQLLEAANRLNGHDNATVALVHCTVKEQPLPEISPLMALLSAYPLAKSGRQPLPLSAALASADSLANSLADSLADCPANSPDSSPSASHPISQAEAFSQNAPATALRSRRPRLRSPRALPLAIALLAIGTLGTLVGLGYQWLNSRPASTRTPGAEANAQRRVPALASALVQ